MEHPMFDWFVIRPELSGPLSQGPREHGEAMSRVGYLAVAGIDDGLRYVGRRSWAALSGVGRRYARWRDRRATVQALSRLDERMLRDIGIDPNSFELVAAELVERRAPKPHPTDPPGGTKQDAGVPALPSDFDCAGLKHAA